MVETKFAVMVAGIASGGMEEYVERILNEVMHHARSQPGCLIYNIHRSQNLPNEFLMYSVWECQDDFDEHNSTEEMQEFKKRLSEKLFEQQSPKTYWTLLE